jgi:hypothetical protein
MALSGGLSRVGWNEDEISHFVESVALGAGDEEFRIRASKAKPTKRKLDDGKKATGWPMLKKLLGQDGEAVVQTVREWLGLINQGNLSNQDGPWESPVELGKAPETPPFPVECLPKSLGEWAVAEATATQTPPDLSAMLALSICGAGLARKYRVCGRDDWTDPTNIFTVTAMPSGERKSAVVTDAMWAVEQFEEEEIERMEPIIADAQSHHRMLERWELSSENRSQGSCRRGQISWCAKAENVHVGRIAKARSAQHRSLWDRTGVGA